MSGEREAKEIGKGLKVRGEREVEKGESEGGKGRNKGEREITESKKEGEAEK